ncbi:MAG: T9SS type A sorting domain-containing protein, partial [Bacteroidales bacterium]|nr:T9SS type A sorting domain-containing protein [Bacteroidales bacterium]
ATIGTVPTDPNSPYPLVNGQKDINLLYNTGILAKTGYTFDGWNTEFDGSGISYSEGATFTLTDNIVLYAKWNPNNYTISWRVNGLSDGDYTYPYNTLIPDGDVPSDESTLEYVCDDKTFIGWSETQSELFDGVPTLLKRNQIVNTTVTGYKTYYAVFADVTDDIVRWNLVTNENDLVAGDSVIIVASEYNYAIGINQKSNNREAISITRPDGNINTINFPFDENVCIFEIQNGNVTDTWAFYDATNNGYIYAASSTSNHLKTENELDDNGSWNITISNDGVATIIAQGTYTHNRLKYNPNNGTPLFSCYTGGQQDVSIYKKTGGTSYSAYTTFCPCAYGIDGISDGDLVWAGKNANADWNSTINWTRYNEGGYHLTATAPTSSNNVYIIEKAECEIDALPHINENTTCNNLTMFNGLGIDIAENQTLTINGTATFTNGVINGNVTFGSSATVSGASTSSHVDGIVTKSGAANGFTFPTGSNGNLGKVVVTDGSATNVSVQYFSNPAGFGTNDLPRWWNAADMSGENPFNHVSNVEYWKISSNEAITADFVAEASTDMHFNSETAEEDRIPANIQMAFYDNNRWTNVGGSASIDGNTLSITGAEIPASATRGISGNYTTFGSKSKSTVLPIELVSFTANCNGRSALIEWTTATEKNNDFFVLERSHDAVNFKEIARIAGAGNSIEPISYAYTDFGVRNGDNYYRLVQFDYDGTSTASEIIVANCLGIDGEPEVLAYPNPFGDDLTLRFENFGNIQATVEVYDMLGRMVHTQKINCSQNDYEVVLRLAGLSDGTYNVRISAKEFVLNRQVIKN